MKKEKKKSRLINLGKVSDEVSTEKGLFDITDAPMVYSKKKGKKKVWGEHASWMDRGLGPKGIKMKDVPGWNKIKGFNEWKEHKIDEGILPDWLKLPDWFPKVPTIEELPELLVKALKMIPSFSVASVLLFVAKKIFGENQKDLRVRFIFPMKDWELKAVEFLKSIGVVTAVFKNIDDAIKEAKELAKTGLKAKEIVLGSHGSSGELLMPMKKATKGGAYILLRELRPMIKQDTVVFFTACEGADNLIGLADVAMNINHNVSGAAGIYNYITNTAEKGYYMCKPISSKESDTLVDKYGDEARTNKALLESGICVKLSKSPISWTEPV